MKGDLPGLSNFCCGYIGSYQYSGLRRVGDRHRAAGARLRLLAPHPSQ